MRQSTDTRSASNDGQRRGSSVRSHQCLGVTRCHVAINAISVGHTDYVREANMQ